MYIPSKMSAYRRDFHKTKCMCCLLKDEKLLETYNEKLPKNQQHYQKRI